MVTMKNPLSQLWQLIHKDTQLRTIAVVHRSEAQQEWKDPGPRIGIPRQSPKPFMKGIPLYPVGKGLGAI